MGGQHKGFISLISGSCNSQRRWNCANHRHAQEKVLKGGLKGSCEIVHLLGCSNLDFWWLRSSSSIHLVNILFRYF